MAEFVGVNDFKGKISVNGKHLREYVLWRNMLKRCYSEKYHKEFETYSNCFVEDHLLYFSNFYTFVRSLKGFNSVDDNDKLFCMDKDLILKGNKQYCRETIIFIPTEINSFLTKSNKIRGYCPIGVSYNKVKGLYQVNLNVGNKSGYFGLFKTPEDAFLVYKREKEEKAKLLSEKWKNEIDKRAYDSLNNYEVSYDD